MSRRETVLIAVFINMCILILLFLGALKPKDVNEIVQQKVTALAESKKKNESINMKESSIDQVDNILSQYINHEKSAAEEKKNKEISKPSAPPQPELPPSPENKNIKDAKYYIVKHGDNPWTIAVKNKIKVEELLRLNNLDESKAKKLKPGDQLRIK